MKLLSLLMFTMLWSPIVLAQQAAQQTQKNAPPLPFREVSGIVLDSAGKSIPGAVVTLVSIADTMRTTTDQDGVFLFAKVKRATFLVTVSGLSIITTTRKYFNNDLVKEVVLEAFELKPNPNFLQEVTIKGKPSITYKIDTVEFKASDYKVRENATVDEMLKKMEGMEVAADGTLTYLGQQILKAKLNGKELGGSNITQVIKSLPADIIEKAQIIDDYGEQAAITGIKDGLPTKVLNLTTKSDRSVGTLGRLTLQAGNDKRYDAELFVQHIDANRQLGFIGKLDNTVNGVSTANDGTRKGSPGTTQSASPSVNYSDQWGVHTELESGYGYRFSNNNAIDQTFGQNYSFGKNGAKNISNFNAQRITDNDSKSHTIIFKITQQISKRDLLQISPNFSYSNVSNVSNSLTENINNFATGFEHFQVKALVSNQITNTNYGINTLYRHIFNKPKRIFSIGLNIKRSKNISTGDKNTDYRYYADDTQNKLLSDSSAHLLTKKNNNNTTYSGVITFSEPFTNTSALVLKEDFTKTMYDNTATADSVLANGHVIELSRLDNIFQYAFTEIRLRVNYNYQGTRLSFSVGATAIPTALSGSKLNNNNALTVAGSHNYFRVIPVFELGYVWSTTQRATITYTGINTIPEFQQVQPFTDRSDPNNIVTGNPNLKPGFTNQISFLFNNYISNSKLNTSLYGNISTYTDQTSTNVIQITEPLAIGSSNFKTVNNITYVNLNGAYKISGGYNLSKSLKDRKYNLVFNGNLSYGYNVAMSNNVMFSAVNWRFNQRFGPGIYPNDKTTINPYIAYDVVRTFTSLSGAAPTDLRTTSLNIDGKNFFFETLQINYNVSKNFITGLSNINSAPLVINMGFEKEFLTRKNLVLTFKVYDILNQNNFTQQTVTTIGVTNTLSNTDSRYFLLGIRLNLQKWGGTPTRNGKILKRKGDGSFIY